MDKLKVFLTKYEPYSTLYGGDYYQSMGGNIIMLINGKWYTIDDKGNPSSEIKEQFVELEIL